MFFMVLFADKKKMLKQFFLLQRSQNYSKAELFRFINHKHKLIIYLRKKSFNASLGFATEINEVYFSGEGTKKRDGFKLNSTCRKLNTK